MKNSDDTILEILQGHKTARWPGPKLAKIFIASTRNGKYYNVILLFILFTFDKNRKISKAYM